MKCYRLFHKAKFLTQLITELSFGKSETRAALIDRPCSAWTLLGVCNAKHLLFYYLFIIYFTVIDTLTVMATVPFVICHALNWN